MKNKKHKIRNLIIYPLTMLLMTSGSSFASQIYKIGETSKGNIYWGNREYNSSFFAPNDVEINAYIEDRRRDEDNPQVILYNSHDLSLKDIRKICAIICDIENIDPTDFDRDYESLVLEWIFHHTASILAFDNFIYRASHIYINK